MVKTKWFIDMYWGVSEFHGWNGTPYVALSAFARDLFYQRIVLHEHAILNQHPTMFTNKSATLQIWMHLKLSCWPSCVVDVWSSCRSTIVAVAIYVVVRCVLKMCGASALTMWRLRELKSIWRYPQKMLDSYSSVSHCHVMVLKLTTLTHRRWPDRI